MEVDDIHTVSLWVIFPDTFISISFNYKKIAITRPILEKSIIILEKLLFTIIEFWICESWCINISQKNANSTT